MKNKKIRNNVLFVSFSVTYGGYAGPFSNRYDVTLSTDFSIFVDSKGRSSLSIEKEIAEAVRNYISERNKHTGDNPYKFNRVTYVTKAN